ncbi:hypothetical protein OWR29_43660 [Actinoplanes sp. Pm04-4]|uniref:Secreted protein n=1 Tax=Paractinoplanes pyxinae TaxID=2997416 RepID=A0ABT4BEH8_9ACTN|nr:hypothetical protein [Actinoplanes pyxinae]MCY1144937.1 hypothetical protein [Actinoplanes pyxinae]
MNIRRAAGLAVSALALTGAGVIATAGPALATPQNCTHGRASAGASIAYCSSGTGSYMARIQCKITISGKTYYKSGYGSWQKVGSGAYSTAYCPKWDGANMTYYTDSIELS